MISIFPQVYPDEILLSWIGRFSSICGYKSRRSILKELFGHENISYNLYYPEYLDFLCSQLPQTFDITPDFLIENHTLYPIFKPFLRTEDQKIIRERIKSKIDLHTQYILSISTKSIFNENAIKVCTICFKEDIRNYGEAYIHRTHQVPGNFACLKHNIRLEKIDVNEIIAKKGFIDINNMKEKLINISYSLPSTEQVNYSQDIDYLMNHPAPYYDFQTTYEKYMNKLASEGYLKDNNTIIQNKLFTDFISFYSSEFLSGVSSYLDKNAYKLSGSWLYYLTKNNVVKVHPMRHLIFIRFLFGSYKEFIEFSGTRQLIKPFGDPPWPCLNRASDHYLKEVVSVCEVRTNRVHSCPNGKFICDCGFIYTRNGPDVNQDDRLKYNRILKFGRVWEEKIKTLILGEGFNLNKIGVMLDVPRETVAKYATILGIGEYIECHKIKEPTTKTIFTNKLSEYKGLIITYLKDHPNAKRVDIRNDMQNPYRIVLKYDRDWFEKNMPTKSKLFQNNERHIKWEYWQQKDIEISLRIPEIRKQILTILPPMRVTKEIILSVLNYTISKHKNNIRYLPKSVEELEKATETKLQFKKRNLEYAAQQLSNNNQKITKTMLITNASCTKQEKIELHDYIEMLVKTYNCL